MVKSNGDIFPEGGGMRRHGHDLPPRFQPIRAALMGVWAGALSREASERGCLGHRSDEDRDRGDTAGALRGLPR
jgi:hypothetical protein